MKTLLFAVIFGVISNCTIGYATAPVAYKIYLYRGDNGEFFLDTRTGAVVVDEVFQNKYGYFSNVDHLILKAFKKGFYCPLCKRKFFRESAFNKHECKNIYNR